MFFYLFIYLFVCLFVSGTLRRYVSELRRTLVVSSNTELAGVLVRVGVKDF